MPKPHHAAEVWAIEGLFQQLIYSPKGAIEGVLIATDGVPTQFVVDPHDASTGALFSALRPGQSVVIEGTEAGPSPKGEGEHFVYHFEQLVSVDGLVARAADGHSEVSGVVVRFNYAKHGAVNGVVLDTGDFVHTRPEGFESLALKLGARVTAAGPVRPLVTGHGVVVEARTVNGRAFEPR